MGLSAKPIGKIERVFKRLEYQQKKEEALRKKDGKAKSKRNG